jgi:hypothetical protein
LYEYDFDYEDDEFVDPYQHAYVQDPAGFTAAIVDATVSQYANAIARQYSNEQAAHFAQVSDALEEHALERAESALRTTYPESMGVNSWSNRAAEARQYLLDHPRWPMVSRPHTSR